MYYSLLEAKQYSTNIRYNNMYISTMFNKPKLIVGTGPTLTELLTVDCV